MIATRRLHHVGIVLPDLKDVEELMALFGLEEDYRGRVERWSVDCVFTRAAPGSQPIEFVVPHGGPLARFNKGVGGIHHLAFVVDSLDRVRDELAREGRSLLEAEHVRGAGPFLCNFVSPLQSRGVPIELVELLER